jgi:peptidoglycan/xylan/chitin deacetylase (PgdA/CDA1 family)
VLALTFDDGPDERWTLAVLDALQHSQARATFFMVGERLRATPRVARAVLRAGHEVQLHCHRHVRHTELDEGEIEADTRTALAELERLGVRPACWRTPWGVRSAATARVAERNRLTLVDWTIDTHDWRGDSAARMLAYAAPRLQAGGIVLMHDGLGPGSRRAGAENTLGLLGPLIAGARSRGLRVGSLSGEGPLAARQADLASPAPTGAAIGAGA